MFKKIKISKTVFWKDTAYIFVMSVHKGMNSTNGKTFYVANSLKSEEKQLLK